MLPSVQLQPFHIRDCGLLWGWLREFPSQNFDDHGSQFLDDFVGAMANREASGILTVQVVHEGRPVGCISYTRFIPDVMEFRGICFTKAVHRTGIPLAGVRKLLKQLRYDGVAKARAAYFEDNPQIGPFLRKFGAVEVPHAFEPTMRGGMPVNWKAVKIDLHAMPELETDKADHGGVPEPVLVDKR